MIWLFLIQWGALFGAALFLIAATPTTMVTPNSTLIWPLAITGVVAGIVTLVVAGTLSLFN